MLNSHTQKPQSMEHQSNESVNQQEEKIVTWEIWVEKYRDRFQKLSVAQKRFINNELVKASQYSHSHQS